MQTKKSKRIAVIGGGIAGIACALRLNAKGHRVVLFEKNDSLGGKMAELQLGDFRFDMGPSLFTEPWLVDELFMLYGKNPRNYYNYVKTTENCRYFFADGSDLVLSDSTNENTEDIRRYFGENSARSYSNYLSESAKLFDRVGHLFLDSPQLKKRELFGKKYRALLPVFLKREFRSSLNRVNTQSFEDPRLTTLFNRFGTYNGSNPFQMPGFYRMIPHLELNTGTYFPEKGMRSIVDALTTLALEENIEVQLNAKPKVKQTNTGNFLLNNELFDDLVCAIDHLSFYKNVLLDTVSYRKYSQQERSTSGLILFLGLRSSVAELGLHNVFFSSNQKKEFNQLFQDKMLAEDPTIYVHNSSHISTSDANKSGQNLFVMVNTPAGVKSTNTYRQKVKERLHHILHSRFQFDLMTNICEESFWDSQEIEQLTGSIEGALYGAASNKLSSSFKRHPNQRVELPNIYFCGGTVHPGGGIPLVLRSAKITAELIS